ncbi:F-box/WD repeat-containing protein pof10-like [Forsythia ovata]|uniref:F-box protein n=1 Tax=Forsythia ovata TaxID=205694 RepID=A0ABD1WM96_9LAMI
MEGLPADLCLKIFCWLDHQNLASAQLVCRKWRVLASDNALWSNTFKERWGDDNATFYAPVHPKSWKDVYVVQHRCDRVGLGLKIIREGDDYYLIYQGEIQRHLGSRIPETRALDSLTSEKGYLGTKSEEEPCSSILDRILFFIGDLEAASLHAKRSRLQ